MVSPPLLSIILPLYNKADVLADVVRALAAQSLASVSEVLFIDDVSTDGSVESLHALSHALPLCRIVTNAQNAGPAIRLNQGAAMAKGHYLCLIDADVLIAPDAAEQMIGILRRTGGQMIHGRTQTLADAGARTSAAAIGATPKMAISDTPLETVLGGGLARMGWVVEADLFRAAGGCDERIFIQDESVALRLAAIARRLIKLDAVVASAPTAAFHQSGNRRQEHHDAFFAHFNLLTDRPVLAARLRHLLEKRCLSFAWKAVRAGTLTEGGASILSGYARATLGLGHAAPLLLQRIAQEMAALPNIRRPMGGVS
jgi:glycosyltransferase involved in cell wall biosynthesis